MDDYAIDFDSLSHHANEPSCFEEAFSVSTEAQCDCLRDLQGNTLIDCPKDLLSKKPYNSRQLCIGFVVCSRNVMKEWSKVTHHYSVPALCGMNRFIRSVVRPKKKNLILKSFTPPWIPYFAHKGLLRR